MSNIKTVTTALLAGILVGYPYDSKLLVTYTQQSPPESLVGVDQCDQDLTRDDCYIPGEFDWMYLFADPRKPPSRRAKHHERH